MNQLTYEDHTFDKLIYTEQRVMGREFQSCTFKNCDLSGTDFSTTKFLECTFESCNLSMAKFERTTLTDVIFKGCKLMGINFSITQSFMFSVSFEDCVLDYSSFMDKKMVKSSFKKTSLKEVTFSRAVLTGSVFDECDLNSAIFNQTDLTSVNFATSYNYIIEPELNTIKKAIFSAQGLPGLLTSYGIKIV
ncbi:MAG: pentapeptide repeat-containing protein [Sphingobacteriaceae bacterium]|nr:MAG: pentapeptide repeat-containing protein [Sphingobacteriaceae bacterium]